MITFVDQIGRTVIGELVSDDKNSITVNNPVVMYVEPNAQQGQLQVQSFPYLFFEFLANDAKDKNDWTFCKSSIAISNCKLNDAIVQQYKNINNPSSIVTPAGVPANQEPEVIKLFD